MLSRAKVTFGAVASSAGYLAPGSGKADDGVQGPLPESAVVEWLSDDGVAHKETVPVRSAVPPSFKDDVLWFEISGTGAVTVRVLPHPGQRQ